MSDINLIPQTLDAERTGAIDLNLGLGAIPVPMFKSFKKSEQETKLASHEGSSCRAFLPVSRHT